MRQQVCWERLQLALPHRPLNRLRERLRHSEPGRRLDRKLHRRPSPKLRSWFKSSWRMLSVKSLRRVGAAIWLHFMNGALVHEKSPSNRHSRLRCGGTRYFPDKNPDLTAIDSFAARLILAHSHHAMKTLHSRR